MCEDMHASVSVQGSTEGSGTARLAEGADWLKGRRKGTSVETKGKENSKVAHKSGNPCDKDGLCHVTWGTPLTKSLPALT